MQLTPVSALRALEEDPRQNVDSLLALSESVAQQLPSNPSKIYNIVIIGLRGVGKSTLALMASADLGFAYVDVEKCVSEYTGKPEAVYLKEVSIEEYQELQYRLVTNKILENQTENSVIVMPSTAINSRKLVQFLQSDRFPLIINVECEEDRILRYMNFQGSHDEGVELIRSKFERYREVATHDFFNCFSEGSDPGNSFIAVGGPSPNTTSDFLVLKPVQKDFSRFLTFLIKGVDAAWAFVGNLHLRTAVANKFSNCLTVAVPSQMHAIQREHLIGIDYLELRVEMISMVRNSMQPSAMRLSEIFSRFRRLTNSTVPIIMSVDLDPHQIASFVSEYSHDSSSETASVRKALRSYYLSSLGSAVRLGADYLSLDLELFDRQDSELFFDVNASSEVLRSFIFKIFSMLIDNRGHTAIIGSYHSDDPLFWETTAPSVLDLACNLSISSVRFSSVATRLSDNYRIVDFRARHSRYIESKGIHVCAYNRGPLGKSSKILNQYLTPVVLEESETDDTFSACSLNWALAASCVAPKLKVYILGSNVAKTASPRIHGSAFQAMGLSFEFELVETKTLSPVLEGFERTPNFGGAMILMPFKSVALQHVDSMSNHVKVIGALNTIIPGRDIDQPNKITSIRGENTDWLGVRIALNDNTSPINSASKGKSAMIIGAGGMARSAIYALIQLGYTKILLYNRTKARAIELADYYNRLSPLLPSKSLTTNELCDSQRDLRYFEVVVLQEDEFVNGKLPASVEKYPVGIVSCVPSVQRETGEPIEIPLHSKWFSSPSGGTVLETGYVPLDTAILKRALEFRNRGWTAVNGLTWLLAQAIAQFEFFTGKQAPVELMKQVVSSLYTENKYVPHTA